MGLARTVRRWIEALGVYRRIGVHRETEFLGNRKGGWAVCPEGLGPRSVVYSAGIGTNATFDLAVIQRYGCAVHAFDPTPAAIRFVEERDWPPGFHFHPWGLADYDGEARFAPNVNPREASHTLLERAETADRAVAAPVYRLPTVMARLGHAHVDLLKLDIEGAEYGVLSDLIRAGVEVGQILVEFHHRFPGVGRRKTNDTIRTLGEAGYRIAAVSESLREYAFLRGAGREGGPDAAP